MTAALVLDSLTKVYGSRPAVRDVCLEVGEGQRFGLFGPNGSGKTTTLDCALGLLRPTRGGATVLGVPARRLHRLRGRVAAVFDAPGFVEGLRVDENLAYARLLGGPGRRAGRTADEALRLAGAADLARRRVGKLSLGQRKRVAVARALLGSPELLVMDEPLAGLDPFGVRRMIALLRRLSAEGITLVLSSHRLLEMEELVTHVGVLSRGRLVAEGPLEELLERHRVLRVRLRGREPAERVLRADPRIEGFEWVEPAADGQATVHVRLRDGARPEDLNRRLVEAGSAVSELVRTGSSLAAMFDALAAEGDGAAEEERA